MFWEFKCFSTASKCAINVYFKTLTVIVLQRQNAVRRQRRNRKRGAMMRGSRGLTLWGKNDKQ
jgi:hypothetical protein